MRYVTKKDIVIPAGTVLDKSPSRRAYISYHVECEIALGDDNTMTLTIPVEDDAAFNELVTELKE